MNPTANPARRLKPRLIDTDWMVLRDLARSLQAAISGYVRAGMTVFDFGCGTMPYKGMVELAGGQYIGADFGEDADVIIQSDGTALQPDSSVDVVLSVQVLEHVKDLDHYFAEIARVLKPDGKLLLSTHGTWLYHPHPEDHRRWTRTGLKNDIETRGFKVESTDALVGPLAWTTLIRLTGFAFALRKIPVVGAAVSAILAILMNIRAQIEDAVTPAQIKADNACVYLMSCTKTERGS